MERNVNFLEKKLMKKVEQHLADEFHAGRAVEIGDVGTAHYQVDYDIIVIHCTKKFASQARPPEDSDNA